LILKERWRDREREGESLAERWGGRWRDSCDLLRGDLIDGLREESISRTAIPQKKIFEIRELRVELLESVSQFIFQFEDESSHVFHFLLLKMKRLMRVM
jgi:hypothetical protein